MANSKKSSSSLADLASKTLRDTSASNIAKRLAGSVLAQRDGDKQTGAKKTNFYYRYWESNSI
jgi:hypothetical protein